MERKMILYHGSQNIIRTPAYGQGNRYNDYGLGFYCTESPELAKEWACTETNSGYANAYDFDAEGLSILNLQNGEYNILNWLAILLENRVFHTSAGIAEEGREYLLSEFLPKYRSFDVMIGYRADDSYFSFANAFLNNTLSLRQLEKAMTLGKLGEQVVLKSKKAFERISFREALVAEKEIYYPRKNSRDTKARAAYRAERGSRRAADEIYLVDILREEWDSHDARLRRNVSE
ncbi:MAG: DUF3990 domain-containing protein [Lachnospiraceae bacterium]|jgi:hypothetical protein|nr:DUF3990 domain-containing protein [Lachnospiraceae bacterium]